MAKRRRPTPDESSYDEGSASDASFTPAPKRTRTRTSTTRRKPRTTAARTDPAAASYEAGADAELACSPHSLAQHTLADTAPLRAALLAWYGGVHGARGMPWRVPYDAALGREGRAQRAYEVWVSEIMLQQTQVATVIPYYTRWMARCVLTCFSRHNADAPSACLYVGSRRSRTSYAPPSLRDAPLTPRTGRRGPRDGERAVEGARVLLARRAAAAGRAEGRRGARRPPPGQRARHGGPGARRRAVQRRRDLLDRVQRVRARGASLPPLPLRVRAH